MKRGLFKFLIRGIIKEHSLVFGAVILLFFCLLALLAPLLAPFEYDYSKGLNEALQKPSASHWMGTDQIGRDLLSRIIYGARNNLIISLSGVFFAYIIALPLGITAGYFGGKTDRVISTLSESILTFPSIVLAIFIISFIGSGKFGLIVTITATQFPQVVRYLRSFVLQLRKSEYIMAAKASGSRHFYILRKHILRNIIGPSMVIISLLASEAVLLAAALGFLGLGVKPPEPEWGTMLSRSRDFFVEFPYLMLFPGISIALLILGFNLLGDGLRDFFDARSSMDKG